MHYRKAIIALQLFRRMINRMNNPWVIGGVSAYILMMLVIGWLSSKNIKDATDYIVAGRRLPLGLATAALFATWFGGGTSMGAAGESYWNGFLGTIADPFGAGLCLLLAGLFYVRTMRRMKLLTIADFFAIKYGKTSELLVALITLPAFIGWVGAEMVALGLIVHSVTGLTPTAGIIISAIVVLIYTYQGGMWADTLTDFAQMIILVAGLVIMFPIVINHVGGFSAIKAQIPDEMFYFFPRNTGFSGWMFYLQAWIIVGLGSIPGQDVMQRALSSKDENTAQWASYLSGLGYMLLGIIPVTLGIVGRLVFPELANSELVLVELAMKFLPNFVVALFVGALLSAIMSSTDSAIRACKHCYKEHPAAHQEDGWQRRTKSGKNRDGSDYRLSFGHSTLVPERLRPNGFRLGLSSCRMLCATHIWHLEQEVQYSSGSYVFHHRLCFLDHSRHRFA